MKRALDAALIDVGGTLWPNSWPFRATDADGRRERVAGALPGLPAATVEALVVDLIESSRFGDEARAVTTEVDVPVDAVNLVTGCLMRQSIATDAETVARVRRAMALPVHDRLRPLPGAVELLAEAQALGLRTVIASNTYWRDAESYWEDFRLLGMADHVDAKPGRCVVIGNREENDILPALALGMRTILVHPDDPVPESSRADAVAPDLWLCAQALRLMLEVP